MKKLPLFYKDNNGKWHLFPIEDFEYRDGRWWVSYKQVVGCSDRLRHFIDHHADKLEYLINSDDHIFCLKEDI
jgi:hypothetical protein